jgi:hypothetical protein
MHRMKQNKFFERIVNIEAAVRLLPNLVIYGSSKFSQSTNYYIRQFMEPNSRFRSVLNGESCYKGAVLALHPHYEHTTLVKRTPSLSPANQHTQW